MTKSAFGVMMMVMVTEALLSADYGVELEPDTAKRQVIAIDCGAVTAELYLHPQTPWRIGSSRIAAQDDFLWSGPYGSYGTLPPTPYLHRYLMLGAHSSREYVKITGYLTQDGSGGTPPWFRVTVPAVDIDWAGYESAAQEDDEDTRTLFCPVTNDVSKCRKLVIRNPLDSGKLRDDPSLLGSNPDMRLTLRSGYSDCFRLLKADGSVFNTGNFNINNIPGWPLELYVDALPNRPPCELEITLEGPAGPDGARTLDRIKGAVIKVESVDVHSSDPETHKIASVVGATGKNHFVCAKGTGDVVLDATLNPDTTAVADAITWEADGATITAPAVGTDKTTAKLSSVDSKKIPVRIKVGPCTCWEGYVWVVWTTITSTDRPIQYQDPINVGGGKLGGFISGGYNFTHTIGPAAIITDADRPDLTGANTVAPPGGNHWTGDPLSGGANKKWDNSRQMRTKKLNPAGIADADFTQLPPPADISYPVNPVEGNDDRGTGDETNDPYSGGGVLTGTDAPGVGIAHSAAADNDTFEWRLHFREFTRLELGGVWYRISDDYLWRIHLKFKKAGGKWTNDSSNKALDNNGF